MVEGNGYANFLAKRLLVKEDDGTDENWFGIDTWAAGTPLPYVASFKIDGAR